MPYPRFLSYLFVLSMYFVWIYPIQQVDAQSTSQPTTRPSQTGTLDVAGNKLGPHALTSLLTCASGRIHAYTRKELFTVFPQRPSVQIQNHSFGMFRGGFQSILHYLEILGCIARSKGMALRYNYDQHLQTLAALSGIPVFAPQQQGQRWSAKANYYNPAWIRWAHQNLIPPVDSVLLVPAQTLYNTVFQRFVRTTVYTYKLLQHDNMGQTLSNTIQHLSWQQQLQIRDRFYNLLEDGYGPRSPDEASYYYHAGHAIFFWLRRQHDGTAEEVWSAFRTILQRFDPEYLKAWQSESLDRLKQRYHTMQRQIHVLAPQQADQLQGTINQAGVNDIIRLKPGTYSFRQALIIRNKHYLTLEGFGVGEVHITLTDPHQDVFSVDRSSFIKIRKIRAKHSVQNTPCKGTVISIRQSKHIVIENNELNGSGSVGVSAINSSNLTIQNNHIHSNSFAGIYLSRSHHIQILRNVVEKNSSALQTYSSSITLNFNTFRLNGK